MGHLAEEIWFSSLNFPSLLSKWEGQGSSLAGVGPGQRLSEKDSLAQICKWFKIEQMCKVRRKTAAGQVLSTGEENPAGLGETDCEILQLKGYCQEQKSS